MNPNPPSSAGQPASPVAPALLERHGEHLRAYLAALPGADTRRVGEVLEILKRELATDQELDDEPAVWLFARARRHLIGPGQRGEALTLDDESDGDEAAEEQDPAVAVHQAFGRLTVKQQEALRLRWQFGFDLEEMARITGLSATGMEVLFQNALGRVVEAFPAAPGRRRVRAIRPALIAYALDEMGAAEKRAFVEGVADGKELLETAEAIRRTVRTLKRVLQNGAPPPRRTRRRGAMGLWIAVAAMLVMGGWGWFWMRERSSAESGASRGVASPALEENETGAGVRPGSTVAWRTADPRERRPGEAAWEKKPFGRGLGQSAGLVGDGQGGGDAPVLDVLDEVAALEDGGSVPLESLEDLVEAEEDGNEPLEEMPGDDTPRSLLTLAGGVGGGAAGTPAPAKVPAGGPGAWTGSTFEEVKIVPGGAVNGLSVERKPAAPVRPPVSGGSEVKRVLAAGGWPKSDHVQPGDLAHLAPPEAPVAATADEAVAVNVEMASAPFEPGRRVVRVVVQAKEVVLPARPPASLVLAIDVSQSMAAPNRLPLVRDGVRRLAGRLRPDDRVAIVTYATEARVVRASSPVGEGGDALGASLDRLQAEGLTNGHEGLVLAYEVARGARTEAGLNAVILCTDGNFNLGKTDDETLVALAGQAAEEGIRLSVFGFGRSDRNDLRLELLARHGGGRSCYVNTAEDAEQLLAGQVEGLLEPVVREVAAQVVFAPERSAGVQVLGGNGEAEELLSGQNLALLYEWDGPVGSASEAPAGVVEVKYKTDGGARGAPLRVELRGENVAWDRASVGFRFAVAQAELERILRGEAAHAVPALERLEAWIEIHLPEDAGGYRQDLLELIALARGAAENG